MNKASITIRVHGNPAAIAAAMNEARLRCVERELEKYPASERAEMIDRLAGRYGAPLS